MTFKTSVNLHLTPFSTHEPSLGSLDEVPVIFPALHTADITLLSSDQVIYIFIASFWILIDN